MTDRINAFTVILDTDMRDDDAEVVLNAISMVKGVLRVEPHIADINAHVAAARIGNKVNERLYALAREMRDGSMLL